MFTMNCNKRMLQIIMMNMRYRYGKVISWDVIRKCFTGMVIKTSKNVDCERTVQTKAIIPKKMARKADMKCFGKGK